MCEGREGIAENVGLAFTLKGTKVCKMPICIQCEIGCSLKCFFKLEMILFSLLILTGKSKPQSIQQSFNTFIDELFAFTAVIKNQEIVRTIA